MAERHVARCDAPECGKEVPLKVSGHTLINAQGSISMGGGGLPLGVAQTFALPDRWLVIGGASMCSWACVARYAAAQADKEAAKP